MDPPPRQGGHSTRSPFPPFPSSHSSFVRLSRRPTLLLARPRPYPTLFQPVAQIHVTYPSHQIHATSLPPSLPRTRDQFIETGVNTYMFQSLHFQPHLFLVPALLSGFQLPTRGQLFVYLEGRDPIYPIRFVVDSNADMQMRNASAATPELQTSGNPSSIKMVRVLAWNCRGASWPEFLTQLRQMINMYRPHMLVILETRISDERSQMIPSQLPYQGWAVATPEGRVGGLRTCWNMNLIRVRSTAVSSSMTFVEATAVHESDDFLLTAFPQPHLQS